MSRYHLTSPIETTIVRTTPLILATLTLIVASAAHAQSGASAVRTDSVDDPVKVIVARLDLEKYKATIKGLTQFGDRRQGTDRNAAAVDWIEAQLKSYGCPTERIKYEYSPPPQQTGGRGRGNTGLAQGGGRPRGIRTPTGV